MNWTEERIELLKKLWTEGRSATQIAAQLSGSTRNSVIGKVHRLKLEKRGRSRGRKVVRQRTVKTPSALPATVYRPSVKEAIRKARKERKTALLPTCDSPPVVQKCADPPVVHSPKQEAHRGSNIVVPISKRLQLVQLSEQVCKWPNGDPLSEDFGFCGNEAQKKGAYCTYHARLAFQPASERRSAR